MNKLTREQEDQICYLIGDWYLYWKDRIVDYDDRSHLLGFAKEDLKEFIIVNMGSSNLDQEENKE